MNPYESPKTQSLTATVPQRLDPGVLLIGFLLVGACIASAVGFASSAVNEFVMPRFGWTGLIRSLNPLIFIGFYIKKPTRKILFAAALMTCVVGLLNAWSLSRKETVDVVENIFHDRVHSAWLWSVAPYLIAGAYIALAALRHQNTESSETEDE